MPSFKLRNWSALHSSYGILTMDICSLESALTRIRETKTMEKEKKINNVELEFL